MPRAVSLSASLLVVSLLFGCASNSSLQGKPATPLPAGFMPTAVALTLQSSGINSATPQLALSTEAPAPTAPAVVSPTLTSLPSPIPPSPTPAPTETSYLVTRAPSATPTFFPEIPPAHIQIFQLGDLSRVASPLKVYARLFSQVGRVVRVELHGEDGRLLGRELTVFHTIPWGAGTINQDMDFEIRLAAELGRLVISVEDRYGRLIDVNSVNLILLKMGANELNPATALWQVIQIKEPGPQTLIQGGTVLVSGLARPDTTEPLRLELISRDGLTLGHRLAAVDIPAPGGYGTFAADVPYSVSQVTPALLVVYESGGTLSEIAHLASVEVMLSP
jgi:hypothetical protein